MNEDLKIKNPKRIKILKLLRKNLRRNMEFRYLTKNLRKGRKIILKRVVKYFFSFFKLDNIYGNSTT